MIDNAELHTHLAVRDRLVFESGEDELSGERCPERIRLERSSGSDRGQGASYAVWEAHRSVYGL